MADEKKVKEEAATTSNLSDNAKKVMEMVEKMTVLELSELVKALEDKFGVSAQAPVVMAGGASAPTSEDAAAGGEEKSEYDVVLTNVGDRKIEVIKAVRKLDPNLGLTDANDLVKKENAVVLEKAKKEAAEEAKKTLEEAGATVELR